MINFNDGFSTRCIHAGQEPEKLTGAVVVPIYQTSTFLQDGPGIDRGYDYTRAGNPTRDALENSIASLEEGKWGLAFSSGMAAISHCCYLLKAGDHLLVGDDVYGGTYRFFKEILSNYAVEVEFVDSTNAEDFLSHIKKNTRMIWLETPSNPLLKITDISKIVDKAKNTDIITVVDNTFMTPYFQKPLKMGVDIVVHSATKYLGGHSDVLGGLIVTSSEKYYERLKYIQKSAGGILDPFSCWLILRGIKTLPIRMEKHQQNAIKLAEFLKTQPVVKKIYYPANPEHPGYEIGKRQMQGFGGMISFEINGGAPEVSKILKKTRVFTLAESLGGVESLIGYPCLMTHASIPKELREKIGITESLIRISVGIEDYKDLEMDLDQALRDV